MRPQRDATHYFTTGGVPILGDPFERIKAKAHAVAASRALEVEPLSQPASKRTHASRPLGCFVWQPRESRMRK
eukprot:2761884-Prymnesium_polylepis.1